VSSGWQNQAPNQPDSSETDGNTSPNGNADENKDGINNKDEDIPTVSPTPEFLHPFTGKEISSEDAYKRPLCFIYDSNSALYGISSSFLTVEIPTEDGSTRFIAFQSNCDSGKIGTLAPTRDYITDFAGAFGGILFAYGNDDSFNYNKIGKTTVLDFESTIGYHYTEYSKYPYTNSDLINAFLRNTSTNLIDTEIKIAPWLFTPLGSERKTPRKRAENVIIEYGGSYTSELIYYSETGKYILNKMGQPKLDLLTDEVLAYDNAFILFANTTTYETEKATECVFDTLSGGKGYYMTLGGYEEITWGYGESGNLIIWSASGEKLEINRGNSYISFVKSSDMSKIVIS
jgi:hypothetical protein